MTLITVFTPAHTGRLSVCGKQARISCTNSSNTFFAVIQQAGIKLILITVVCPTNQNSKQE